MNSKVSPTIGHPNLPGGRFRFLSLTLLVMKCRQSTKNAKTADKTTILVTSIKFSVLKTLTIDVGNNTAERARKRIGGSRKTLM